MATFFSERNISSISHLNKFYSKKEKNVWYEWFIRTLTRWYNRNLWKCCICHRIFDLTKGPANTFISLSTNAMQLSAQTDNHKYRKNAITKKALFKKMVLKFWNSNLNILCDIAFIFFNKMPTLWSSEVNWVILEQVEKWRNRIMIICFNFLRNKNYVHKTNSRNSALYKFHIKIYLESFVSIYHLYHLFGMIYKSISYNFNITLTTGSSVKPSISGVTLSANVPWGTLLSL